MRNLLTLLLLTIAVFAYSQTIIPLEWDTNGVNNCDDDGDLIISADGAMIEAFGLEGPDCVPCQSLSASGACTLPGNGSLCSFVPNVISTIVDRSDFASLMLDLSIEPMSSNLECTACSTSDLAFIEVTTLDGEVLSSIRVCGSEEGDFTELELPESCDNFVVIIVGFKSNGGDEGFRFEINASGVGEPEMNRLDFANFALEFDQLGCPGDTSMITATATNCMGCSFNYRLPDGSINTDGLIPIPEDFTSEEQLIDILITDQCGTIELPSVSIPVINDPQICGAVINNNPSIFDQFPFLLDNYEGCTDIEFQIITSGIFTFIYVSDGQLFFQDGTLFCTEVGDRDCRALYNLHGMPTVIDSCGPTEEFNELTLFISDSFRDEETNAICVDVTTGGIEDLLSFQFQIESALEPVSFSSNIFDESTIVVTDEDSLFIIKSLWIAGDLNPIQLSDIDPIYTVCFDSDAQPGMYEFNLRNTDRLFSQFVVRESTGGFREIRDVELSGTLVIEESEQSDEENMNEGGMDGDEMNMDGDMEMNGEMDSDDMNTEDDMQMDGEMDSDDMNTEDDMDGEMDSDDMNTEDDMDMDGEMEEDEGTISVGSIDEAIELFPFLEDIDVCGRRVTAYSFGELTFLSIGEGSNLELYFEDGTFYCSSSESFDCLEFYELTQIVGAWECPPEVGSIVSTNQKSVDSDIAVFPNPFSDYIELDSKDDIVDISLFGSDGREHPLTQSNKKNRLNVASLKSGAYFLRIKTQQNITVKQIIKL